MQGEKLEKSKLILSWNTKYVLSMTPAVVIIKCYGVYVRKFRETSRFMPSGFQIALSD